MYLYIHTDTCYGLFEREKKNRLKSLSIFFPPIKRQTDREKYPLLLPIPPGFWTDAEPVVWLLNPQPRVIVLSPS